MGASNDPIVDLSYFSVHPEMPLSFESIMAFRNRQAWEFPRNHSDDFPIPSLFVFRIRDELSLGNSKPSSFRSDEVLEAGAGTRQQQMAITLKGLANQLGIGWELQWFTALLGSMHSVADNTYMVYMCSLNVTTIRPAHYSHFHIFIKVTFNISGN
jgi:hypothetical protein